MCELIRAALANGKFGLGNIDFKQIPKKIVDKIECVKPRGDLNGPSICAANSSSFFNKADWTIFLFPSFIKFAGKPKF